MSKRTKDETRTTDKEATNSDEILVVTSDPAVMGTRGGGPQPLKVEELAVNVNLFVQQVGKVLQSTPESLGKFHFDEFEIHAEINADTQKPDARSTSPRRLNCSSPRNLRPSAPMSASTSSPSNSSASIAA